VRNAPVIVSKKDRIIAGTATVLLSASYLNLNIWQLDILGLEPSLLMGLGTLAAMMMIIPVAAKYRR
jgi:hypothetical protein